MCNTVLFVLAADQTVVAISSTILLKLQQYQQQKHQKTLVRKHDHAWNCTNTMRFVPIGTGGLLTLSTAAVVGIVIALIAVIATAYTCGLLTGLLVRRNKNHVPSPTGDLSSPMYEQVLPPTQTSISLKENEAYGQFNS